MRTMHDARKTHQDIDLAVFRHYLPHGFFYALFIRYVDLREVYSGGGVGGAEGW